MSFKEPHYSHSNKESQKGRDGTNKKDNSQYKKAINAGQVSHEQGKTTGQNH